MNAVEFPTRRDLKIESETPELSEDQKIPLQQFSNLVGFPSHLVKKELALDDNKNQVSMHELRQLVLSLLNTSNDNQ